MSDRLTKSDWVKHGLRTLAKDGPNALKVGAMAQALNVSRGSFYWHFRDISDFRSQLLQRWQGDATDQVIHEINAAKTGALRLNHLMKRAFGADRRVDQAIRSWAAQDDEVARIVAAVDIRRVDYISQLLVAAGVASRQAPPRAAFIYWAYLGQAIDMDRRHSSFPSAAMNDIAELFTGPAPKKDR